MRLMLTKLNDMWNDADRAVNRVSSLTSSAFARPAGLNGRFTMNGLKMTSTTFNATLAGIKAAPFGGDLVWDGQDEDERPLGKDEMLTGMASASKRRGRPQAAAPKSR